MIYILFLFTGFIGSLVTQRIRDFFVDALYKSTFTYLLTYCIKIHNFMMIIGR